jgi:hypothetical protein
VLPLLLLPLLLLQLWAALVLAELLPLQDPGPYNSLLL